MGQPHPRRLMQLSEPVELERLNPPSRRLHDDFVLIFDVGGDHDGAAGVLDLRDPDALTHELTSKHSPGRLRIASWGGTRDRDYGLEDLG